MAKGVKKKVDSSGTSSKNTQTPSKNTTKILIWIGVVVVLIAVIIILVSVLSSKVKENEESKTTTCELNNYSCYNNSCPTGYAVLEMNCKTGQVCCKQIPPEEKNQCERVGLSCFTSKCSAGYKTIDLFCYANGACCKKIVVENRVKCELQGFQCFGNNAPDPTCPLNYVTVNQSCRVNEICCKEAPQKNKTFVLYGYVRMKEGNCMPPTSTNCTTKPLVTRVAVFPKTLEGQMNGPYFRTAAGPIKMTDSNASGYYQIELPYGEYSVFASDPLSNNDYYCNTAMYGGAVCFVPLENSKQYDMVIDHSTQ